MPARRSAILPAAAAAALALLALGACKKEGVVAKDESVESVARKVAEADTVKPRAGRWESTVKLGKMDIPGMPPQAKEAMSRQAASAQTFATCLTDEQAKKPGGEFFQKGASGCKYDRFVMADGRIDAEMTCQQQGRAIKSTLAGTYGADAYDITARTQSEIQPGKAMTVEVSVASRRTGECNGTETK